jgi:hypothetical protein
MRGFNVTQVWPCCCSHVRQLRGSVLDQWSFHIRWGTSVTGSQCASGDPFVSFWSRRVAFRTLTGTFRRSQTRVLRERGHPDSVLTCHFSDRAIGTPSHCAGIATTRLEGWGPVPGLHSDTSSSARCNVWRPRSTAALCARRLSSPNINSFMTLATKTQIFSGSLSGKHPSRWGGLP